MPIPTPTPTPNLGPTPNQLADRGQATPSRRAASEQSRQRILDAAEHLLAERGYAGTGISAISKASGLPASSIYWHFQNKQQLLGAVVERGALSWLSRLGRAADQPGEPRERLAGWLRKAMVSLAQESPDFMRLLVMVGLERQSTDPELRATLQRVRGMARSCVEEAIEEAYVAELGQDAAHEIARRCAPLAIMAVDGYFVSNELDAEPIVSDFLTQQMVGHVLGLADLMRETALAERI